MSLAASSSARTEQAGLIKKFYLFMLRHYALVSVLLALGLAILYVNPFHETSIFDDWAYVLTSKHLYDTGNYQLHEWSSANIMFQAYWGVLFALVGGFSIGTLHISTLVLLVIGIISFYILAQDHGLAKTPAALLAFCLVANPVILYFSFSFMTDVPSLSLLIVCLMLYTRGLKQQKISYMGLAGLVSIAAIFTRPTALALLPGLGLIFWLDRVRWQRWRLYLAGGLPLLTGGMLLMVASLTSQNTGTFNSSGELKYISHFDTFLAEVLLWRPGIFLIYMGVFAMPLAIVCVLGVIGGGIKRVELKVPPLVICGILIAGAILYNVIVKKDSWTVPYIAFTLQALSQVPVLGWLVTLVAVPGGLIFGAVIWQRVGTLANWRQLPLEQRFLDVVTLFLLVYHLLFFNLGERYLFVLTPFTLIVVGRYAQPGLKRLQFPFVVAGCIIILLTAIITRFHQSEQAAEWEGSNYALSLGATPLKVFGPWGWYCSYNLSDYLKQNPDPADLNYMFDVWLPRRSREADYLVVDNLSGLEGPGWQVVKTVPYTNGLFQPGAVFVVKRVATKN